MLPALAVLLIEFASISASKSAVAAESIMINSPNCKWCDTWVNEVGVVYTHTGQVKKAQLQLIEIDDALTLALCMNHPVTFTPTFLIADDTREVGRITVTRDQSHF